MAESVGTVHLNISADLDTLGAQLRSKLSKLGPELGRSFSDQFSGAFAKSLTPAVTSAVKKSFDTAQRSVGALKVDIDVDTAAVQAKLDRVSSEHPTVTVNADADTAGARAKLDAFRSEESGQSVAVNADADTAGARAKLAAFRSEESGQSVAVNANADTAGAKGKLAAFRAEESRKDIKQNVNIDVSKGLSSVRSFASGLDILNNKWAIIGAAGVAGIGVVIPVAVAATGAVLALGSAAVGVGAAFGVAKLAFSGVGKAITALDAQQSKAGESAHAAATAALTMASAHDSLKSALQGVSDAQHAAGLATSQASQQTVAAEQSLQQAQQDALQTQKDLNVAREQAVRDLEDIANRATDAALNERQASLDLTDAQAAYNAVLANPKSTQAQKERAKLTRDEAVQRAKEAKLEAQRSADDAAKARKAGVEGSSVVTRARQAEKAAIDKVHAAQQDLTKARQNEAEVARKNAESIAKAEQGVIQAQRGIQSALLATQQVGSTTANAVNEAFDNLTPAGKHFAKFIYGLKGDLDILRGAAQSALLPPLEKAIKILLPYLPQVKTFITNVGKAMGDVAIKIARMLTSKDFKEFFSNLGKDTPKAIKDLGDMFVSLGHVIIRIFNAARPYVKDFLGDVASFFKHLDQETSGEKGKSKLQRLFQGVMPVLAAAWEVIKSIGNVLGSFVKGATAGKGNKSAADILNDVANAINKLATFLDQHPQVAQDLTKIAAGMVALKAGNPAIGAIGGVANVLGGLANVLKMVNWSVLFGTIGAGFDTVAAAAGVSTLALTGVGLAIIAVGVGLYLLYTKCQWFHDKVNMVAGKIRDVFVWLWDKAIKPALEAIGKAFHWLYDNVIKPVWDAIKLAIDVAWAVIQVIFGLMWIGIKILGKGWNWLYDHVIKPVWDWISDHIKEVWNKHIRPILLGISQFIHDEVAPKFKKAIEVIGVIWDGLKEIFKAPIRFLIETVLDNGLIDHYNTLASAFGVNHVDRVPVPDWLKPAKKKATGGSIIGPGTGTSDSIPALLSNGEHVWTAREVRAAGGHQAVEALRQAVLQGAGVPRFATGGAVDGASPSFFTDPLGYLKNIALSAFDHIPGGRNGLLSQISIGGVKKLLGGAAGLASKAIHAIFGNHPNNVAQGPTSAGVERWRSVAVEALRMTGQNPIYVYSLLRRMNQESGGNPTAINLWDSNARAGTPSKGLMQVIDPTFARYHLGGTSNDIYDPLANIAASIQYAMANYGSLTAAYDRAGGYDSGGWLQPGSTLVHNDTGKPEAVFNPAQWATLEANLVSGGGAAYEMPKQTNINTYTLGDPDLIAASIVAAQARQDLLDTITR